MTARTEAVIERFRRMAFLPVGTTPEAIADHFDTILRNQPCAAAEARVALLEAFVRKVGTGHPAQSECDCGRCYACEARALLAPDLPPNLPDAEGGPKAGDGV